MKRGKLTSRKAAARKIEFLEVPFEFLDTIFAIRSPLIRAPYFQCGQFQRSDHRTVTPVLLVSIIGK